MDSGRKLESQILDLEQIIQRSNIPKIDHQRNYSDFFTAYAIIRGIMEEKSDEESTNRYGALAKEHESSLNYVNMIGKSIAAKKFAPKTLYSFIREKIKIISRYENTKKEYSQNGLRQKIVYAISTAKTPEEYFELLSQIGRSLKNRLKRINLVAEKQDRVSNNPIAELGAVYKTFRQYRR